MNHIIKALIFLVLLTACSVNDEERNTLLEAERQIEQSPDSAFHTLDGTKQAVSGWSRSGRMKYNLLLTRAKNSTDRQLPSDSAFLDVVDYYDSHGSSNERMLAHYLLGCIYREKNEAPQAIQCYCDAVDCADTLDADCDYGVLYRIYGQMAEVYQEQFLYKEALEASDKNCYYAHKEGNLYDYLHGQELKIPIYYSLGDTAAIILNTERCAKLYRDNGFIKEAACLYPTAILLYLDCHKYKKAYELMRIFETQSGLFDKKGNIQKGLERYYFLKVLYYTGTLQTDSAEYYSHKLLRHGYTTDAYRGFLKVYALKHKSDSIASYATKFEQSLDSFVTKRNTEAVLQVSSLYDYARNERIASLIREEAQIYRIYLSLFVVISLLVASTSFYKYRKYKRGKQQEIARLNNDYLETMERLATLKEEKATLISGYSSFKEMTAMELQKLANQQSSLADNNDELSQNNDDYAKIEQKFHSLSEALERTKKNEKDILNKKENEIKALNEQLDKYNSMYGNLKKHEKEMSLASSDIVKAFKENAKHPTKKEFPASSDWDKLLVVYKRCYPCLLDEMEKKVLTIQEMHVCILTRLRIPTNDIANVINVSPQRTTNIKATVNKKLFNKSDARSLYKNLLDYDV